MATINARKRTNVAEQGHVQAHTIKKLGPTAKRPKATMTPTPDKMTSQEQRNQSLQTVQEDPLGKAKSMNHRHPIFKRSAGSLPGLSVLETDAAVAHLHMLG